MELHSVAKTANKKSTVVQVDHKGLCWSATVRVRTQAMFPGGHT